ncbi:4-carboxy-4-hydroxy-2-oxoadipate aldolase/oxaloacetate decarboxylase [Salinicola lusitanus]|uniref:4-carboxy-4-hydroxy-2-oxoadipate aldolase/oxaloacetate decarboxylase n=1 Tax=Salinicola lusitanus TaxID=1949085 RepID=UPI001F0C4F08|nr:4-carboxy-4-hydroxy-2-oxoadipate aldolase/oxaloacetate decarboxylase [Salinicola lusitanus]
MADSGISMMAAIATVLVFMPGFMGLSFFAAIASTDVLAWRAVLGWMSKTTDIVRLSIIVLIKNKIIESQVSHWLKRRFPPLCPETENGLQIIEYQYILPSLYFCLALEKGRFCRQVIFIVFLLFLSMSCADETLRTGRSPHSGKGQRMTSQTVMDTLKTLGSATIHEAQGQRGAMDSGIKPLDPTLRVAGRALTVDCSPGDNLLIHYAISKARPGDVLVVDAKGFTEGGPWGDILTLAATLAGISGLIIDGMVRDADTIIESRFPVFCRGLSIKGTHKHQSGKVNETIQCGGVAIRAGDIVVGDRDGVVVVASEALDDVITASQAREEKEEAFRRELEQGASTLDLLNLRGTLDRLGLK